jgi:hypothetical protein
MKKFKLEITDTDGIIAVSMDQGEFNRIEVLGLLTNLIHQLNAQLLKPKKKNNGK